MNDMDIDTQIAALIPALALGSLLAAAVVSDVFTHRIPNTVCLLLLLSGIAGQTAVNGTDGTLISLAGVGTGLIMLLPFYVMGGMAAGDVKLLAAGASYLGPVAAIAAGLITLIAGAGMALLLIAIRIATNALRTSQLPLGATGAQAPVEVRAIRGFRFPYAVAIAAGLLISAFHGDSLIAQLLLAGSTR